MQEYKTNVDITPSCLVLVAYEEIQRVATSGTGSDEDAPADAEETGRQSTALLEKTASGKIIWKHVHETWIEGKSPTFKSKALI